MDELDGVNQSSSFVVMGRVRTRRFFEKERKTEFSTETIESTTAFSDFSTEKTGTSSVE